jgi:hypothetical protein
MIVAMIKLTRLDLPPHLKTHSSLSLSFASFRTLSACPVILARLNLDGLSTCARVLCCVTDSLSKDDFGSIFPFSFLNE